MWIRLLAALAVLSVASAGMAAELPTTGRDKVFYSIEVEQVAAVLRRDGFKTTITQDEKGEKPSWTIEAERKGPFYMYAEVRACNAKGYPKGCLGIRFYASAIVEPKSLGVARRTVDRYNRDHLIGKAYLSKDGKALYVENYLMIEGGVTEKNLDENLLNFQAGFDLVMEIWEEESKSIET